MKNTTNHPYLLILSCLLTASATLAGNNWAFIESDGLLVIEMETTMDSLGGWAEETSFSDYTGAAYFRYADNNHLNSPGIDTLQYTILIQNPGLYRFRWRSLIAEGTSNTDANDSWLKINSNAFYGRKGANSIVCPIGYDPVYNDCPVAEDDDMDVTPEGSGSGGWFKIYRSGPGDWVWSTQTSDNDAHQIYARFDYPGLYTIAVSGRSKDHAIDRMVLYRSEYSGDPLDTDLSESTLIDADFLFSAGFEQ